MPPDHPCYNHFRRSPGAPFLFLLRPLDSNYRNHPPKPINPRTIKNKTAPSGRAVNVELIVGMAQPAVNILPELADLGKQFGIYTKLDGSPMGKSGNWYFNGQLLGGKREDVIDYLHGDVDTRKAVEAAVRAEIAKMNLVPNLTNNANETETIEGDETDGRDD